MAFDDPSWLNAEFIQNILRNTEKDEFIELSNIIITPAVPKGENYLGDLYRVSVEFWRGQRDQEMAEKASLIVKVAPRGHFRENMISETGFFTTEMSLLSKTFPRMNKLLEKINTAPLTPYCYYVQHELPIHLIMEDLEPRGYRVADRRASLDLDHCLIALRRLAVFHASSVALQEKNPRALMKHRKGWFHKDHPASLAAFFNGSTKGLGREVANWPELSPRISEKISKLSGVFYKRGLESARFRENDFNVLNHGDFWVNNMMFRYNKQQKPIDLMFIDFQISQYGSPAIDLLYFMATSPRDDIRENKREYLLREYHVSLTSTMAKLKCNTKTPSFEELQEILKERAFYEVVASFIILPLVLVDNSEHRSFDEMMVPGDTCENLGYRNKLYRKVMSRVLPLYDSMGLLDS